MEKEQHSASPLDIPVREQTMERADFEKWAHPILGDNPTWQESGQCELAWQAWKESAKAEREACAEVCATLRLEWSGLKVGATDGRYGMMEEAAEVCEGEIRERYNVEITEKCRARYVRG